GLVRATSSWSRALTSRSRERFWLLTKTVRVAVAEAPVASVTVAPSVCGPLSPRPVNQSALRVGAAETSRTMRAPSSVTSAVRLQRIADFAHASCKIPAVVSLPEHFNAAAFFVDRHVAEGRGARMAFRFGGRAITYADVAASVDRCANALAALGVEPEHRVLLVLNDSPAFVAAFWGAAKLGAVAVPVNTLMT